MASNQQWRLQKATLQLQSENQNRNPNNFSSKTTAKSHTKARKRAVPNKTEFRLARKKVVYLTILLRIIRVFIPTITALWLIVLIMLL